MKLITRVLDIMFRRIAPEPLISALLNAQSISEGQYKKMFMSMAEATLNGYSYDEQENIYEYYLQRKNKKSSKENTPPFYLLLDFADETFEINTQLPTCKYSEVLNWREAYLLLGQDIFTTAWLAGCRGNYRKTSSFSWPPIIPVDNHNLNRITNDIAENHLHLFAGASTFSLTWSCIMNHPESVFKFEKHMGERLDMQMSRYSGEQTWSVSRRTLYAAELRILLFTKLIDKSFHPLQELRKFHFGYSGSRYMSVEIAKSIDALRALYGVKFEQPGYVSSVCLDYAFTNELCNEADSDSRLLAAERLFLYKCFRMCFDGGFSLGEQWMFYAYLLLKSDFRSELVQVNNQTGFYNFRAYDFRKKLVWERRTEYFNEDIRQAINSAEHEQGISSLEAKVGPQTSPVKALEIIYKIDMAKLFSDCRSLYEKREVNAWNPVLDLGKLTSSQSFFYMISFPKRKDKHLTDSITDDRFRHMEYRQEVRRCSISLAKAMSNHPYICERVLGIDACSAEIGCRPEVFAQAFRFLRNFSVSYYCDYTYSFCSPKLSASYHVGEDFLDIADGLRAMDEVIYFLNFSRGDRFGHALALGVDPKLHYKKKRYQIILPKQDLLDNLVWLCCRSVELGVSIKPNLKAELSTRAERLYQEIYATVVDDLPFSMESYYRSIMLRGDAPELYSSGEYKSVFITDPYDFFAANKSPLISDKLRLYRNMECTTKLMYSYHYCKEVKITGEKLDTMDISDEYIRLIVDMQKAMRRFVNEQGISIECNPSSNVLIGTFDDYKNHPILNFNNKGLNLPQNDTQMHVSVNSDDPGVFDTSLKFEYALLAKAISEIRDENGEYLNDDRDIEDYMRNVVEMGREQAFLNR